MSKTITIDGLAVPFQEGQTIMDAALAAGVYIPHLCHNPEFKPHGSCKLCTVNVNGRNVASCTMPAVEGQLVLSDIAELNAERLALTQMLFVEGNHLCPACEKSGNCQLQAVAYYLGMMSPHYNHFYPQREADASHPDVMLDRNRCIYCELCVRASREVDGKNVFGLSGRGIKTILVVNSASGLLGDTDLAVTDKAVQVCPTGAILIKRQGYAVPIGQRVFDRLTIKDVQTGGSHE
ncbi:2Fe-2S iron-sulfur cluster-binding protein [Sulfuricella sp.]|uniref:2Fe-2S iron-sulfur cluster-binding protein n=1 Tax=Sulfuricella sp. TaxID=2099377 RepID=UPI002BC7833B|nr:2Fe-2S iron-sulfur cluster-binding protein [Sulfuricella sp.]HUX65082.1 2Fe-2S iron-sulfur cluster-binding protein [Sulfuricella sp.]